MKQAYLYKWTQKSTSKWYVGSRTAKNCHINDGYICSSKVVKPLIVENKDEWSREILAIGETNYIINLETAYLKLFDAKADLNSFNMHNGDGKFSVTGMKFGPQSESHKKKLSASKIGRVAWNKGKTGFKHSEESKEKIRLSRTGKKWDATTKLKISKTESETKQLKKKRVIQ
jgi:hypothetical protein